MTSRPTLPVLPPTMDRRCLLALGVGGVLAACADDARSVPADGSASATPDAGRSSADAAAADARDPSDAGADDAARALDGGEADAGAEARDAQAADATSGDATAPDAAPPVDAGPPVPPPPGFVVIGPMSNFPLNRWSSQGAANQAFIVARDAAGVFIYSAICTHTGCIVPPPAGPGRTSTCPCHLSTFDDQGLKLGGPARGPLTHRAAFISGDVLYVHATMVVAASVRTPVP